MRKMCTVAFTTYVEIKYKATIGQNLGGEKWMYCCNIYLPRCIYYCLKVGYELR